MQDVRERLLKQRAPSEMENSVGEVPTKINMYELALKLPQAPFSNSDRVNEAIQLNARLLIMGSYDWLDQELEIGTNKIKFEALPELIKLFKCLRNASAHNNNFRFHSDVKKSLPLRWGKKTLTVADENHELFSRWMALGDIEYLLRDVSKELANFTPIQ